MSHWAPARQVLVAYWLCFAAALGVYAAMVTWTLPGIAAEAGGLTPFDMRPFGYSHDEALAFLSALTDEGRRLYTGPQKMLDAVYPAFLAIVLAGAVKHLFPRGVLYSLMMACIVAGMAADYLENMRVAIMLAGETSPDAIAAAARATVLKSSLTGIAMIVILGRLIRTVWHKWTKND
ncbi:hypothetical protein DL239_14215 [Sedimentitalea sp. CY04]|uniref:VanZ like family protein n=1 Tax=Parasedimentitalea denitrificans TaxID=2211118 RepID=A0ABX0WAA1_9RHOB|nr:hypothetical protein [Sedimentitalea sp. CY04]NIZ62133.1 hypothetical protein [Sedimentitalea sp. CY04]